MKLFTAFCFILSGCVLASRLEPIIESEENEGQQGIYHVEDLESTSSAVAGDGFPIAEMASALPKEDDGGFKLQNLASTIVTADLKLWWELKQLDDNNRLGPYFTSIQEYASLLERIDEFEDTKKVVEEQLVKAQDNFHKAELKMAAHRHAFAMNLMEGQDTPTEKITYFPRSVLATPDDKLILNKTRAEQMDEDAANRAFHGDDIAKFGVTVLLYEESEPILLAVTKAMAEALKQAMKAGESEVKKASCSLPLLKDTAGLTEGLWIKSDKELRKSGQLIYMKPFSGSAMQSVDQQIDESPLLVRWELGGTEMSMSYEKKDDGSGLLHITLPDLGKLEDSGYAYHLSTRIKRVIRDAIFNQFLVAFALQHHSIHVDLSPFMVLNLEPSSLNDAYDYVRRVFSDIQPGEGYEIKEVVLCYQS